jgi:hypothetical protein
MYILGHDIPKDLIDRNVRIDFGKLRHLIILDRDETKTPITNGNFSRLKQIIEEEEIVSKLVTGFPVKTMVHTDNFISLLYYFGLFHLQATFGRFSLWLIPATPTISHRHCRQYLFLCSTLLLPG